MSPPFSVLRNITESIGCLGAVCAWHCDVAEKVWRRAGGGREGRTCGMLMSQIAGTASYSCGGTLDEWRAARAIGPRHQELT